MFRAAIPWPQAVWQWGGGGAEARGQQKQSNDPGNNQTECHTGGKEVVEWPYTAGGGGITPPPRTKVTIVGMDTMRKVWFVNFWGTNLWTPSPLPLPLGGGGGVAGGGRWFGLGGGGTHGREIASTMPPKPFIARASAVGRAALVAQGTAGDGVLCWGSGGAGCCTSKVRRAARVTTGAPGTQWPCTGCRPEAPYRAPQFSRNVPGFLRNFSQLDVTPPRPHPSPRRCLVYFIASGGDSF